MNAPMAASVAAKEELLERLFINCAHLDFLFIHCCSLEQAIERLEVHVSQGWRDWMGGPQKAAEAGFLCSLTLFRSHADSAGAEASSGDLFRPLAPSQGQLVRQGFE